MRLVIIYRTDSALNLYRRPDLRNDGFHRLVCARGLIEHFGEEMTITAELWRELGNFDKSIELCQKLIAAGTDVGVVKQILERAQNSDPSVFILMFDKED